MDGSLQARDSKTQVKEETVLTTEVVVRYVDVLKALIRSQGRYTA